MSQEFLQIASIVFGIAGMTGGASAYFLSSRAKTTIALQKDEIDALSTSLQRLQGENTVYKGQITAMQGQISALQGVVTSAPQIEKLAAKTAEQHEEVITALRDLVALNGGSKRNSDTMKPKG